MYFANKKIRRIIRYFFLGSLIIYSFWYVNILVVDSATMEINPNNGNYTRDCTYPFSLNINLGNKKTKTIDAKIYLDGFDFVKLTGSNIDNITTSTGISLSGDNIGREYLYINGYQNKDSSFITGDDNLITTILLKSKTGMIPNGEIIFYFLGSGINADDSNISYGLNGNSTLGYTQYIDILTGVSENYYSFVNNGYCPEKIYFNSGYYMRNTNVDFGYDYQEIAIQNIAGQTIPKDIGWTYWTNTGVTVKLQTNQLALLSGNILNNNFINISGNNIEPQITHTLIITNNISGSLFANVDLRNSDLFEYNTGFTGNFLLDVFWIDTTPASLEYSINFETDNHNPIVILNSIPTGYADRTTTDDEFKIIGFSGNYYDYPRQYNNPNYSSFEEYIYYTGNIFQMQHELVFDIKKPRSGNIITIDRAGNTGEHFIDVNGLIEYGMQIRTEYRNSTLLDNNGIIFWLTLFETGSKTIEKHTNPFIVYASGNILYTGIFKSKGDETIDLFLPKIFSGIEFDIQIEGMNTYGKYITGIKLYPKSSSLEYTLDFGQHKGRGSQFSALGTAADYFFGHGKEFVGDLPNRLGHKDGLIGTQDLAILLSIIQNTIENPDGLGVKPSDFWVYSGGFFVHTGTIDNRLKFNYLGSPAYDYNYSQYHYADIDGNGRIQILDYSLMTTNVNTKVGFLLSYVFSMPYFIPYSFYSIYPTVWSEMLDPKFYTLFNR